ncbi:Type I restriction-modification system, specificity subunit S [Candidatus Syntrophocurvum alkaliphilum]|uniref:Type I restriction-modification system, specificity subunit S n=1 Tax=Candidatus Syntrophocurvum alkaliphilum TaxID=2293317 RepID=A0A6I6DGX7_9FIRM|nr:restriction endonuclease subunit S [Candidatus Syntrophocurvum alkaliphilum]QGU00343.1 Type I restriction-modification system, specificity subunit S [Candidatus Syntrophocurvum alkaliphilum]
MREGYKKTELGEIPEEWEVKKLSKIARINPNYKLTRGKTYDYIAMSSLPSAEENQIKNIKSRVYGEASGSKFKEQDTLFARITPCTENGKCGYVEKLATDYGLGSTEFVVLSPFSDEIIPKFLYYTMRSERIRNYAINRMLGTTGRQRVAKEVFTEELSLSLPHLKEQKKIADILSTVDEQIEQIDALIEKTKELKKGLMQKLLTKGIGHTKFKKTDLGEIPEEWELKQLSELGDTYSGLSGKNKNDFGFGKPFIPYKNIFDNTRININNFQYVNIKSNENQNKVKYGDIFFTTSSESVVEVGMSSVLLDEVDEVYLNSFCFGYRLKNFYFLIPEFAAYLLRSEIIRKKISVLGQGSTRYNLSKNELMKLFIPIPPISEQQKIAEILSSVDEKLENYQTKKQNLELLKKGLMQKLLTGQIRVKV